MTQALSPGGNRAGFQGAKQFCFSSHSGTERHHRVYDIQAKKFIQRTVMRGVRHTRKIIRHLPNAFPTARPLRYG